MMHAERKITIPGQILRGKKRKKEIDGKRKRKRKREKESKIIDSPQQIEMNDQH